MSEQEEVVIPAGRPIRLVPTPQGFWLVLLGVALAAIAPLFGFLIGSMSTNANDESILSPLYWGLFIGIVTGGLGVLAAVIGGRRLWLNAQAGRQEAAT